VSQAPASSPPRGKPARQGLTLVFTGNGKGKTTAAVGLTVRAVGNRMRVFFLQFIKGQWKTGEREILRGLPGVDLEVTGRGFTIESLRNPNIPMEDHAAAAAHGWQVAQRIVRSGEYDMVVLDEILGAVKAGLVPLDELIALVQTRPPALHLVLTGRDAPPALVDAADLVSEIQPLKHPFERGIKAQRGIEF
jgi:cob(I)alamin adenosyltransferase